MNKKQIKEMADICIKTLSNQSDLSSKGISNALIESCEIYQLPNDQFYCKYGQIDENEIKKILLEVLDNEKNLKNMDIQKLHHAVMWRFNIVAYEKEAFNKNIKENVIPVYNGSICIVKNQIKFNEELHVTPYRLPVRYDPKAPTPTHFLKWINELFMPEDIKGFQEFMGYCLVPTTKAQKMLLVMGNGREGKSIIGQVLKELLGDAWVDTDVHDIAENRFTLSTLDYKLVAYQDDTDGRPMKYTANFKKLVTNNGRIMVERKGIDKYESIIFTKVIACSNHSLSALSDDSDGFFRRIYPIKVKPRPNNRVEIKGYAEPIIKELEGILNWCLEGLIRLQKNDYEFTQSQRSIHIISDMESDANNIEMFINERLEIGSNNQLSTREIYNAYCQYCVDYGYNGNDRQSHTKLTQYLRNNAERLNIQYKRNNEGSRFIGIKIKNIENNLEGVI